jgi:hypothetical protein
MELGEGALHLIALASIGLGVVYCFLGYRIFKVILGISGFILGASVAARIAFDMFGGERVLTILAGLVGGVVGAVLMVALYFVGIFLLGAWLGSLLGVLLTGGGGSTVETVIILVLAVIGGVVAVMLQKLMIIISTSLSGSWGIVSGIFHFLGRDLGPIRPFQYHPNLRALRPMGARGYIILLCWVLLGIAGIVVQYKITRESKPEESG